MTKPNPTAKAVEAALASIMTNLDATERLIDTPRATVRELLTAAYPQIVSDVLNHYADEAESPAQYGWVGRFSTAAWLRDLAKKM